MQYIDLKNNKTNSNCKFYKFFQKLYNSIPCLCFHLCILKILQLNPKQILKTIKMYKVKEESVSSIKSHCRVGKITSRKNVADDFGAIQFDFRTEAFKKSNMR